MASNTGCTFSIILADPHDRILLFGRSTQTQFDGLMHDAACLNASAQTQSACPVPGTLHLARCSGANARNIETQHGLRFGGRQHLNRAL
jgi:hypothetical protein